MRKTQKLEELPRRLFDFRISKLSFEKRYSIHERFCRICQKKKINISSIIQHKKSKGHFRKNPKSFENSFMIVYSVRNVMKNTLV